MSREPQRQPPQQGTWRTLRPGLTNTQLWVRSVLTLGARNPRKEAPAAPAAEVGAATAPAALTANANPAAGLAALRSGAALPT